VLVVPADHRERDMRSIAVAYDGREGSRRALRSATALAERLGAGLVLIGVTAPAPMHAARAPERGHDAGGVQTEDTLAALEHAAAQLLQRGFDVSIRTPIAKPGPGIVEACADDVDLLFAGSRAHRAIRSALEHSVSRHLVDHAPCPVLVVAHHATLGLVAEDEHATAAD
jgi:nucleotide-binding universal stress UspA family protein